MNPTAFLKKRRKASSPRPARPSCAQPRRRGAGKAVPGHGRSRSALPGHRSFPPAVHDRTARGGSRDPDWADLCSRQGQWYLDVVGKGSKARRVYLPDAVRDGLEGAAPGGPRRAPNSRCSPISAARTATSPGTGCIIWSRNGPPRPSPGRTSRPTGSGTAASPTLAARGASLESIKALAGHESIETTMHYNEAAQLMKPAGMVFNDPKRGTSR